MTDACGIALAGGRGERFGGPKAFALLPDGRSFLEACRDLLAAAGCNPIFATLPPGGPHPVPSALHTITLPAADLEMFDSLQLALAEALAVDRWQVAVILPVDHPLVDPQTVVALCRRHAPAAVPRSAGKRGHPVAVDRSVAMRIVHVEPSGVTLRDVLHAAGALDVDVDDPGVRANCNTPDALAAAWARLRRGA